MKTTYHYEAQDMEPPSHGAVATLDVRASIAMQIRAFDDSAPESVGVTFPWPPGATRVRITAYLTARPCAHPAADFVALFALRIGPYDVINVHDRQAARAALWIAADPDAALVTFAGDLLDPITFKRGQSGYVLHTFGPYDVEVSPTGTMPQQLLITRISNGHEGGDVDVAGLNVDVETP